MMNQKSRTIFKALCVFLCLLTLAVVASAQTAPQISGRVTDKRGDAVGNARVVAVAGSQTTGETKTAADGRFTLALPPGDYEIQVLADGFSAFRQKVSLNSAQTTVNITLEPATVADTVTVTPARTELRLSVAPASVSVFDAKDVSNAAAQTFDDLLRQAPGFSVFRRSSSIVANPTTLGVSLRGAGASGASRTLVLSDGAPLNDAFGGWVYWDRVPRAAVDRIELVRGGSSDLYGSDALSGVINVITRPPTQRVINAETAYGNRDTADVTFFASDKWNNFSASLTGEAFRTDGYFLTAPEIRGTADDLAASKHRALILRLQNNWDANNSMFIRGSLFDEDRRNGTIAQTNDTASESLVAGGRFRTGDGSDWNLTLFANRQRYHQTFSAVAANRNSETLNRLQFVPSRDVGVSFNWSRVSLEKHLLVAGIDVRGVRGVSDETAIANNNPTTFSSSGGRQRRAGFFAQDLFSISPRWQLSVNARYDNWRDSAAASVSRNLATGAITPRFFPARSLDAFSPRLSLIFRPTEKFSLRASAYRAFRAPTLNELYRGFRVGNTLTNANASLVAERLTGGEAGMNWTPNSRVNARVTGYWTEIINPISNFTLSVTPALITRERRNLGRTRSRGIEAETDINVSNFWRISAGYLFADATVRRAPQDVTLEGLWIPQVPRHQFTLQTVYANPRHLTAALQFRASGKQFDDDRNRLPLGGFAVFDVTVSRPLVRYIEAFVAVQNLFDKRYAVARTPLESLGMPRMVRGGVRLRFER
ncbi:MAG TPA: TonB-dependent receptor [Blastocatellia bacterium]|nr:TonB-dependent receptor [Blastocatellia bacterium]